MELIVSSLSTMKLPLVPVKVLKSFSWLLDALLLVTTGTKLSLADALEDDKAPPVLKAAGFKIINPLSG